MIGHWPDSFLTHARIDEAGALPSPAVMLSDRLKQYYDPLRLPLDHSPLPVTGYRRVRFPPPQDGAEEALSSSQDTLPTVPQSLRREVPRHPLQDPRCLPWPSPINHGLGSSLFPLMRAFVTTLQLSLHVTDRSVARPQKGLCHSASTTRISPAAGSQLPGTLASPQTGLTPAGCPELDARLHRTLLSFQRPSYWTHGLFRSRTRRDGSCPDQHRCLQRSWSARLLNKPLPLVSANAYRSRKYRRSFG